MEIVGNLVIAVCVLIWVQRSYANKYKPEKLVWILIFYEAVAFVVSLLLFRVLRRLAWWFKIPLVSVASIAHKALTVVGGWISYAAVRGACTGLGVARGLTLSAAIYTMFLRSRVDAFVLVNAVVLSVASAWMWSIPGFPLVLCLMMTLIAIVACFCAASLYGPMVSSVTSTRIHTAPTWAMDSIEAAFSFTLGLSAPIHQYKEVWPDILKAPLDASSLADTTVRDNYQDSEWVEIWLDNNNDPLSDARKVANAAFLCKYGPPRLTERCRQALKKAATVYLPAPPEKTPAEKKHD